MKSLIFLAINIFAILPLICFGETHKLDNSSTFSFYNFKTEKEFNIKLGRSLIDQMPLNECCSGTYRLSVPTNVLQGQNNSYNTALYIPAIGGLKSIKIGTKIFNFSDDYSSSGPILPIETSDIKTNEHLFIDITVSNHKNVFSGLWRGTPKIGPLNELISLKENDRHHQELLPLFNSLILLSFGFVFLIVYFSVGRRNKIYLNFSASLFSWSLFYLFVSGYLRKINYDLFCLLHFPVRVIAGYGLLLLVNRSVTTAAVDKRLNIFFILTTILNFTAGALDNPLVQIWSFVVISVVSFFPLLFYTTKRKDLFSRALYYLSWIALLGQCLDAIKMISGFIDFNYNLPFFNRWTFTPLLVASFGDAIIQFSGSFHQLRTHLFKAKSYARTILHSAKEGLSHDNINYFLKVTSKICGFNRVSLAHLQDDGSYKVIKLYGSKFAADGSTINLDKSTDIKSAILNGKVTFGNVQGISEGWKTTEFVAVPVPEEKNPPYLLLLSDPKNTNLNSKDVLPYLSQISSAIWTNLERTKEQNLRIQTEKKFGSLVQKLDPSLYEFITRNINKIDDPNQMISATRGIVFFDQKAYSTMTEEFDDATMGKFARIVGEWVTQSAARYGARISNFAGDAYLLETFSIGTETEDSIAERTLNLVWNLAQTMGELNQILLKEGFTPVTFRFGAHIGNVTEANLDFIQKGLSNSIGDTVNVTARLQSLAKAGSIYISGELQKYVSDQFITTHVPKQYVKGRMKKIDIFSLIGKVETTASELKRTA